MVYAFGIGGFIGGFALGLVLIGILLRSRPRAELLENQALRWTYGLAVWVVASLGAWVGTVVHGRYFFQ